AFLGLSGPKELGGAVDLISQYKLWPHHEFFYKRTPPLSLLETHYLRHVVGNIEIKRGEGMELDQLFWPTSNLREKCAHITTFDLEILSEAFQMRDSTPIDLSSSLISNSGIRALFLWDCEEKSKEEGDWWMVENGLVRIMKDGRKWPVKGQVFP
ncbi:hypothetical protein Dsin_020893, partial [Dipteronia sinensis]